MNSIYRKFLKFIILSLFLSGYTFLCNAEELPINTFKEPVDAVTVKVNKKWTITFKKEVDVMSLNGKIYVSEDPFGVHKVEGVNVVLSARDPRQVEVIAPENGYKDGVYYLFVDKGVTSITKTPMKENVRMKFVVLDNSLIVAPAKFGFAKDSFVSKKNKTSNQQDLVLPSSYDLRKLPNKLSPIRDQGGLGNCWAFSTLGSLESTAKDFIQNPDLSEQHMKNIAGKKYDYGINGGGNRVMATAYLASGMGPIEEKDDPYLDNLYSVESPTNLKPVIGVSDVDYIVDKDKAKIKEAVYKYGAVYSGIFYRDYYFNGIKNAYYFDGYDGDNTYANHAVDIVGWDDNYSRDNFWGPKPKSNGAFIVRNSWGTGFGEQGYMYVSYEDKHIGTQNALFRATNKSYDNTYQYDTLGCTDFLNYSTNNIYFANVFEGKGDEIITAVSFYTDTENTNVKIYMDNQFTGDLSRLIEVKSTSIQSPGYHTVILESPIKVKKGYKFAVGIGFTLPVNLIAGAPVEKPVLGFSSNAIANRNQSYISGDGKSWIDLTQFYPNTNVCIKVFTNNEIIIDKTLLNQQLDSAVKSYDAAIEGTAIGQYEVGARTLFKLAIDEAKSVAVSVDTDQLKVNAAAEKLKIALADFQLKQIKIVAIEELKISVKQNDKYSLPAKVTAKLSNNTTEEVLVVWTPDSIDTSKVGIQNFTGKVEGYTQSVFLTLTVE